MNRSHLVCAFLVAFVPACGITEPEPPAEPGYVIRGVVMDSTGPLGGARVVVKRWSAGFDGLTGGNDLTGPDGRFEIRLEPCNGWSSIEATLVGYRHTRTLGFAVAECSGTLDGVEVWMEAHRELVVETSSLPAGVPTLLYQEALHAVGGDEHYTWSVVDGSLPPGLELSSDSIQGRPSRSGEWSFSLQVTDGAGVAATQSLSIVVIDALVLAPEDSCYDSPDSAVVTFRDPELLKAVRRQSGIRPDELLTCGAVARVSQLGASGPLDQGRGPVTHLAGLQNLRSLTTLDLSNNRIESLESLAGLTNLVSLDISANRVTDLTPLASLTGLEYLRASSNSIHRVEALTALSGLRTLDLAHNSIASIDALNGLDQLVRLYLAGNEIRGFPSLDRLDLLETLDLEGNRLLSLIGVSGLSRLRSLNASSNPVAVLGELTELPALQWLALGGNQGSLTDITSLSRLLALEHLDLSFASVSNLEPLRALTQLRFLDLEGNEVSDLSPISRLEGLTSLNLNDNRLSNLAPISGLLGLTELRLEGNSLTTVDPMGSLVNLLYLDLGQNSITETGPLEGLTALNQLHLWGNADLTGVEALIANDGLGDGDIVSLYSTAVVCADVRRLEAKGVTVPSDCS